MTEKPLRFVKEDLTTRQLLELFRDVRKGYVAWHSHNGTQYYDYKMLPNGDWVPEDPLVAEFNHEQHQRHMWREALRAIRHGRVAKEVDTAFEGYAVAVMNYRTTHSLDWGPGADWETCYVLYERWFVDGEEYEGDEPWVFIDWDGYP